MAPAPAKLLLLALLPAVAAFGASPVHCEPTPCDVTTNDEAICAAGGGSWQPDYKSCDPISCPTAPPCPTAPACPTAAPTAAPTTAAPTTAAPMTAAPTAAPTTAAPAPGATEASCLAAGGTWHAGGSQDTVGGYVNSPNPIGGCNPNMPTGHSGPCMPVDVCTLSVYTVHTGIKGQRCAPDGYPGGLGGLPYKQTHNNPPWAVGANPGEMDLPMPGTSWNPGSDGASQGTCADGLYCKMSYYTQEIGMMGGPRCGKRYDSVDVIGHPAGYPAPDDFQVPPTGADYSTQWADNAICTGFSGGMGRRNEAWFECHPNSCNSKSNDCN